MSNDAMPAAEAVSDSELGRDIVFGMVVGTPLVYVVVLLMCLLADTGVANAFGVAILPCVLSGVFFGGVYPLSRQMARHEAAELHARGLAATAASAAAAATVVDPLAVVPAA
jgi:MFS family permease